MEIGQSPEALLRAVAEAAAARRRFRDRPLRAPGPVRRWARVRDYARSWVVWRLRWQGVDGSVWDGAIAVDDQALATWPEVVRRDTAGRLRRLRAELRRDVPEVRCVRCGRLAVRQVYPPVLCVLSGAALPSFALCRPGPDGRCPRCGRPVAEPRCRLHGRTS